MYGKRSKSNPGDYPDWDRIDFRNRVPRPWERETENRNAAARRYVELEIPPDIMSSSGPGHFPVRRVWQWAVKEHPGKKIVIKGHKVYMLKEGR